MNAKENVLIKMVGTKMVIEVETDLSKVSANPSASGKTLTVGTTGGILWQAGGLGVNLTVSKK